ncbi:uncharacterized protein METZ01_LOCUS342640, partial [marine metagenome]
VVEKQFYIAVAGFGTHEPLDITGTGPCITIDIYSRCQHHGAFKGSSRN